MSARIKGLDHWTILTRDQDRCVDFYEGALGLAVGPRPDFDFPGVWLYSGDKAIVHVVSGREVPEQSTGAFDHIAFAMEGPYAEMEKRLEACGISFVSRRIERFNIHQIACEDPDGCGVELNFQNV